MYVSRRQGGQGGLSADLQVVQGWFDGGRGREMEREESSTAINRAQGSFTLQELSVTSRLLL